MTPHMNTFSLKLFGNSFWQLIGLKTIIYGLKKAAVKFTTWIRSLEKKPQNNEFVMTSIPDITVTGG